MIKNIAVLGAGTMGHGIAETFAMYGFQVNLYEVNENLRNTVKDIIKKELLFCAENGLIDDSLYDDLKSSVENVDYVIEATPEIIELKQKLFMEIDGYCKKETIFASNTSSFLNWAFGTIVTPILAMELTKNIKRLHFPMLVAAGYSTMCLGQCLGPSASVYALLAGSDHFLVDKIGVLTQNVTTYNSMNVIIWFIVALGTIILTIKA